MTCSAPLEQTLFSAYESVYGSAFGSCFFAPCFLCDGTFSFIK